MSNQTSCIRPDWLIPVSSAPVQFPVLCRRTGSPIPATVVRNLPTESIERLPNSIVMPAFVNAHTHLDLSGFDSPLGHPGIRFADWLIEVIGHRRLESNSNQISLEYNVRRGLSECVASGASMVGNIAGFPWAFTEHDSTSIRVVDFLEQLGANAELASEKSSGLDEFVERASQRLGQQRFPGISPHAPYSMSRKLFDMTVQLAQKRHLPIAMHLAESLEERRFLEGGTGPFRDVLESAGVDATQTNFPTIEHCLKNLADCKTALVVHGNYLTDVELDLIAAHAANVSVVWCPRTHSWFGHSPWPLGKMIDRGICVAIGTDSRASNPDLDLLGELKAIAATHPALDPRSILKLGTLNGVQALTGTATSQIANSVLLQYVDEIRDEPESAVLSLEPLSRKLFPLENQEWAA